MNMLAEELLLGLTEPQREAVLHAEGPLLVLAGPGSGKTRVITHRAAYLARTVARPWQILALTFTNKAAHEMGERISRVEAEGITCSTFHAFCARLLRIHGERIGLKRNFSIYDDADQTAAMKNAIRQVNLSTDNFTPGNVLNVVGRAKNDMLTPTDLLNSEGGWHNKALARAYEAYEAILAEQNAVDFDDLLLKTAWMLRDQADVREKLSDQYKFILVDEYQDTNHAQYMIARLLAMKHENLCVTGDPDQSIYAWRGANLHNILQFEEDFPNAKVVRLEQNYRSTPQILAAADAIITNNRKRKKKKLWTANVAGPDIFVAECEDSHAEAGFIAAQIRQHVQEGGKWSDVAVFYRVNSLSRNIEAGLRDAHIPYQVARGVAFYNRKEIKDVLAYLKVTANPLDRVALERIINEPPRGIGKTTVERVFSYAAETQKLPLEVLIDPDAIPGVARATRHLKAFAQLMADLATIAERRSVQDTIEFVVRHSGLIAMWSAQDDEDALENVSELISAGAEYDRQHPDGSGSLIDWLQQVSLVSDVDAIDAELGAVTLMTLHAAKGLEFDTVFMVGLEDGLLPHRRSETDHSDIEEERRLCFVGMTRAERALTMSHAKWRDFRGVTQRTCRSPFLKELPKEGVQCIRVGEDGHEQSSQVEEDLPESSVEYLEWRRGQLVRHPDFGIGRVMWIEPRNHRTHAGIAFAAYGEKTLILEYAKLQVVDVDEQG